jgi:CBS domain-containing protein
MKKVADILKRKNRDVISVAPDLSVLSALELMAAQNIGSLMITDDGAFLGIMTERDYSRKVILKGKSSTETTVSEIMSTDFPRITPKDTVEYCMQLLSDRNLRYLPVFEAENVCGIISINDVVTETIRSHEETITHLKDYLHTNM